MSKLSFKQPEGMRLSVILLFALILSACAPAHWPTVTPATSTPAGSQDRVSPSLTPAPVEHPADAQPEYTNRDFGFSLNLPEGYTVQQTFVHMFTFIASQDIPGNRGMAWMTVERGLDQDAAWYADQARQENANLGIQVSYSSRVIAGQPAYILGRMPGQDLNRQVFIVYKGILYHLTFIPDDPQTGMAYQQMETLYAAIINSLRFLPERHDVPPVLSLNNMAYQLKKGSESRTEDDLTRLVGDDFFVGYGMPKTPEEVTFERVGRNEVGKLILDKYLAQTPSLTLEKQVDWTSRLGDPFPFSRFFPDQVIYPILVKGWGPQGADEAVMIIGQRRDGGLYWKGIFVTQGAFTP